MKWRPLVSLVSVTAVSAALVPPIAAVAATECEPLSSLTCDAVPVEFPYGVTWQNEQGGLSDSAGAGTGFTAVDASTTRYSEDLAVTDPTLPGYEAGLVSVDGSGEGTLTLTATPGDRLGATGESAYVNALVNAVAVAVPAADQTVAVTASLAPVDLPATDNGERAGIWYGLDEDTYISLDIVNGGDGEDDMSVRLQREVDGVVDVTSTQDALVVAGLTDDAAVSLRLTVDPLAKTAAGEFAVDDGPWLPVVDADDTSVTVPDSLVAGALLPDDATGPVVLAGISASTGTDPDAAGMAVTYNDFLVTETTPPTTPANLVAVHKDQAVDLSWDAVPDADSYVVFQDGGSVADGLTEPSYTADGLDNGTEYAFQVVAVDATGNTSAPTAEVTAIPQDVTAPGPVLDLAGEVTPEGSVALSWTPPAGDDVASYQVFRADQSPVDTSAPPVGEPVDPTFTDAGVSAGSTYYYAVTAVDEAAKASEPKELEIVVPADSTTQDPTDTTTQDPTDTTTSDPTDSTTQDPTDPTTSDPTDTTTNADASDPCTTEPCSIWDDTVVPPASSDTGTVELGVRFSVDTTGQAVGVRFYKPLGNDGEHIGRLWTADGVKLAQVTFANETSSGWQSATFSTPVDLVVGETYVVSYLAPQGRYAFNADFFAAEPVVSGPITALQSTSGEGNGVYRYLSTCGAGADTGCFPASTFRASNYWVDVLFQAGADVSGPSVVNRQPSAGAAAVSGATSVVATFSESLDPASVTTSTVRLLDPDGAPVPSTVSYDDATRRVTLVPDAPLLPETTYQAVVSGGSDGVTDAAGNPLATDDAWSFTTAGITGCPCTVYGTDTPVPTPGAGNDGTPIELGVKVRSSEAGFITSVRVFKSFSQATTLTGRVYTRDGTLLAEADQTFASGTTGWQEIPLATPVSIDPDTNYVASYYSPDGHYAFTDQGLVEAVTNDPLTLLADGADGANGLYRYGGGFPTDTFRSASYFADVAFVREIGPDTTPPAAPTQLAGVPDTGSIALSWTAPADPDVVSYDVYRSEDSPVSTDLTPLVGVSDTSFIDTGVSDGTTYYYAVTAVDDAGNASGPSNELAVTAGDTEAPDAPLNLSAVATSAQVDLSWQASPTSDVSEYEVYRSTSPEVDPGVEQPVAVNPASLTVWTDGTVSNGTTYYYVVRAVDEAGNASDPSTEVSATPQAGQLAAVPASVELQVVEGEIATSTVAVTADSGTPTISASSDQPWLSVVENTTQPVENEFGLTADAAALAPGAYEATATFTADGYVPAQVPVVVSVSAGCDGANPVVAENCLSGTPASEWDIDGAGDLSIQGFATDISIDAGQSIDFKIDTTADDYDLPIYRLGYYGGDGARLVDTIPASDVTATEQPACLEEDIPMGGGATTDGALLDCGNWSVSATWQVPDDATSGVYIARPTRTDDGGASHIVFIVRDDASTSDVVFQTSDTTWQSYNPYGGYNAYGSSGATMAEKLSYNRPFTTRGGELENWLFSGEYPMIRWLERNGYDVSYISAVDTERNGALLTNHDVFLSVGHDEYWSQGRRDAVTAARDSGVNLSFFSANEIYWKTRWESSNAGDQDGQAYRTQVVYKEGSSAPSGAVEHRNCYNNYDCDPTDVWTGQWREAPGSTPENALSGQISWRLTTPGTSMTVRGEYAPLRFWRNTDVATLGPNDEISVGENILGYEWDPEYPEYADFYPAGRVLLSDTLQGSFAGDDRHHLSMYRADSGALVFGAGTVQWSWGLDATHDYASSTEDGNVQQATVNVLADMGAQPATPQATLAPATASTDTAGPTTAVTSPANGDIVAAGSTVTVTGTAEDVDGQVGVVEVSVDGGTTWRRAEGRGSWSYTFSAPSTTGDTATVLARATDDSVNTGATSSTVELTVGDPAPQECPCTIFGDSDPGAAAENDGAALEVGVRFRAAESGSISAVRLYKAFDQATTLTGRVYTNDGTLLGEGVANYASGTTGWQQITLDEPVAVAADTTYVASYYSPDGYYSLSTFGLTLAVDNPPLSALEDGVDGANGVYRYGGGFPNSTWNSSNYFADVVFTPGPAPEDTTSPTVVSRGPGADSEGAPLSTGPTVTFSEALDAGTVTSETVTLSGPDGVVPASVTYDSQTLTVTIEPTDPLAGLTTYTVTSLGGVGGVADPAGNSLEADDVWSFVTASDPAAGPGGPVLAITDGDFGSYLPEILRAEGLNLFATGTTADLTASDLADYSTVIVSTVDVSSGQASALATWVDAGGNLVVLQPDSDLAALAGLTPIDGTISEGYVLVDTSPGSPGAGIAAETMQFHGIADLHAADAGTDVVATLYSDATTPTGNPAVTLRDVGTNGGQVAAFTYNLPESVVLTRQGNPAWINQDRSPGGGPTRSDDLFYGGDEDDYVDLSKVAIPQADEQQRLLANLVLAMAEDAQPLPRFWYLPRGEKAAVVLTADEHNAGDVAGRFESHLLQSPGGCDVDDWQCVRATSYLYPNYPGLDDADVNSYQAEGFEVALHPNTICENYPADLYGQALDFQLGELAARYPSLLPPTTSRNHCIAWTDYTTVPEELVKRGIRLSTDYYFWPADWVQDTPGLFTGTGFAQRYATSEGELVDVYQATTQYTDESGQSYPQTVATLLDRALGGEQYFGTFVGNLHTDGVNAAEETAETVATAQARGVPVITSRQLLGWTDGRNESRFSNLSWDSGLLTFDVVVASAANGLEAMIPLTTPAGSLQAVQGPTGPLSWRSETIKGMDYAFFSAASGTHVATYAD